MTTKKKKHKPAHQISIPGLIELAGIQIQRGEFDDALNSLRVAEIESKKYQSSNTVKKVSIPPHIIAAQAAIPSLLARAHFQRSFTIADPKTRLAEIDRASNLAPDNLRYLLGRAACQLLLGEVESAEADLQAAHRRWPEDESVLRASSLVSSSAGGFQDASLPGVARELPSLLAGLSDLSAGNLESARAKLNDLPALDHNPSRAEAAALATQFFYHGVLYFHAHDYQAALGELSEALRLSQSHALHLPWHGRLAAYFHRIAEDLFESNQTIAIECWKQALTLDPEDGVAADNIADSKRTQADQAWNAGSIDQAAPLWEEVLSTKPNDEQALRNLAIASEKLGKKKEALTHWRRLAQLWRKQARLRNSEAGFKERLLRLEQHVINLMLETGSNEHEISNELEVALSFDPDNPELRLRTAQHLVEIGKPRQALRHLEALEKQQGVSADLLVRKAESLDLLDRANDARKAFERALELEPSNPVARRSYVIFLDNEAENADEADDLEELTAIREKQLSIDPDYQPAMSHLAAIYLEEGRNDEAKQLVNRMVEADPRSPQRHVAAGKVYLVARNKREAAKFFKKAIELEPSAVCHFFVGFSYWGSDYKKDALKHFDRAAGFGDFKILIQIATTLVEDGALKESEQYLKQAMKMDPSHPIPHMIRGVGLLSKPFFLFPSLKDFEEAVCELTEAERLMVGQDEYRDTIEEIRRVREEIERAISSGPKPLLGGLGGLPFDLDDDPFDDDPGPFIRRKKKGK